MSVVYWDHEKQKTSQYDRTPSGNIKLTTHQMFGDVKKEIELIVSATKATLTKIENGKEIKSVDLFDLLDRIEALEGK